MILLLGLELVLDRQQVGHGLMAAGLAAQQHAADLIRIARRAVPANRLVLRGGNLNAHTGPQYIYGCRFSGPANLSPNPSPRRGGELFVTLSAAKSLV